MANKDLPCGFEPHGRVLHASVMQAGSTIYPGDPVRLASDGQIDVATAGQTILGVALSYATVGQDCLVSDAKEQVYIVQADEADIDAQTDIGNLFDHVATAGDSTYKVSRQELDSSTASTTSGGFMLIGVEGRVGDALGANVKCLVRIAEPQLSEVFAGI